MYVAVEPQQQLSFHVTARRRFFALVDADVVRRIGHQVGQLRRLAGCMRCVQGDDVEAGAGENGQPGCWAANMSQHQRDISAQAGVASPVQGHAGGSRRRAHALLR